MKRKGRTARLHTPFEATMPDVPFSDYPRPQLRRESYLCLNGTWHLSVCEHGVWRDVGDIRVPFAPQSAASGVEQTFAKRHTLRYERTVTLPDGFRKNRLLLHIGAADQMSEVFINGHKVSECMGGYWPYAVDVTQYWQAGENRITIDVIDLMDTDIPYGKQREGGGMWYTPISGIWQTVWMESVPSSYVHGLKITPTLDSVKVEVDGGTYQKRLVVHTEDGDIETTFEGNEVTVTVPNPKLWTPETPHLYRFTLHAGEDTVTSYFALRTVSVGEAGGKSRLLLNGKPYFFHGLLDHGYYSDGIYLPSIEEGYRSDIRRMKELGFNMLRKHIKIEPEVFYYECDRQGMIVFQDMVNNGRYSFLRDTALPTVGFKRGIRQRGTARSREMFWGFSERTVTHLYNHPCVCYYTVFNEGWGQYDADRLYRVLKASDPTRIWDATSGWFFEHDSDVDSEHVYFKPVKLKAGDRPLVLSEFGGYSCKIPDHAFNLDKTYGYRYFTDTAAFEQALIVLYRDEIVPAVKDGLCAAVLTQLSDVEDETNGLLTYDRQVCKVDVAAMRAVAEELQAAFLSNA
ncbi:MAG: glycoside hydrolase family 2 [Clostridia bacterium]|nr:glycoside hydrolase family 2 [Clostridia bacterium]